MRIRMKSTNMGNLQVEKLLDLLSSKAMANLKLGEF